MPSHFSSIGFPIIDNSELETLVDRISRSAVAINTSRGTYWRWSSECGAELWLQADLNNELVGITPYFNGKAKVKVAITERISRTSDSELSGALHGWADPDSMELESGIYPFVFDLPDYAAYDDLKLPRIVEAHVAAFAHEISLYPSLEAYCDPQTNDTHFASRSFIPSGLFTPDGESTEPPEAFATFTGHITAADAKVNELTGERFWWVEVDSLGGSFDVVIDPALCAPGEKPQVGGVLSGSFWLCGRLILT